jgi:chromosome segregation ATPase
MSETETLGDQQRVGRWLAEGQDMLGRVIPALVEDRDRVRQTLEARERECEQLRGEVGELRRNLGSLQSELERLRGERVTIAEAFGGVADLLGQIQRPLEEMTRRLHAVRPVTVDTSAA